VGASNANLRDNAQSTGSFQRRELIFLAPIRIQTLALGFAGVRFGIYPARVRRRSALRSFRSALAAVLQQRLVVPTARRFDDSDLTAAARIGAEMRAANMRLPNLTGDIAFAPTHSPRRGQGKTREGRWRLGGIWAMIRFH